jgi:hypothetical protein
MRDRDWLSAVVMHHPSRDHLVPELVRMCAPLRLRIIADPDPSGQPSPLRTAKRAWAAVADGASHHLVLQDDVVLPPGFAGLLGEAIAHRPDAGIALYVNWNSPQNAYHARRAAVAGSAWAPLSRWEYTPALGFVLPAGAARALGEYLSQLPDDARDDDEGITRFCRDAGLEVYATVPNLLEHADGPSLSGYDFHGRRRSVAYVGDTGPEVDWAIDPVVDAALLRRITDPRPNEYVVELLEGRCTIRFLRPLWPDPVDHPYGWHWFDWCPLIGVDPRAVTADFHRWRVGVGTAAPAVVLEGWAAGYLLGASAGSLPAGRPVHLDAATVAVAVRTWAESGLRRCASPALVAQVATACLAGLRQGAPMARDRVVSYA